MSAPALSATTPAGYSKKYATPWSTSFDYIDASGASVGKGFDSYQDAIRKLAFTSGARFVDESSPYYSMPMLEGAAREGWEHSYLSSGKGFDLDGKEVDTYNASTRVKSLAELWTSMVSDPSRKEALTYDSREKYGRALTEGQLQNMYAQYASGVLKGAVPDWTYHRAAYNPNQPLSGIALTGEAALIGSTAVFDQSGKVAGYIVNASPEHINLADKSGRVQSSTSGATRFNAKAKSSGVLLDDGFVYIAADDAGEFGYQSFGTSSYSKEDTGFAKVAKGLVKSGILAAIGAGFADFFSLGTVADAASAVTETGQAAGGVEAGAVAQSFPVSADVMTQIAPDVFEMSTIGGGAAAPSAASLSEVVKPLSEVSKMFEIDYSQDPFATTESVNTGWNEVTGYGVDYYGQTGGATDLSGVNDIFGTVTKTLNSAASAIKAAGAAYASTRQAVTAANRTQPNYTRAAGSINIGVLALAGFAFLALRG